MRHYWPQVFLIPFTLLTYIGSLLVLLVYRPTSVRYYKGVLELVAPTIFGNPLAQSWGCRVNWFNTSESRDRASIRVHERVHTLHGEWTNAVAHLVLVTPAYLYLSTPWVILSIILAQLTFGASYLFHFLFEWRKEKFNRNNWFPAYKRIWTERIAYRVADEFKAGLRTDAWGK